MIKSLDRCVDHAVMSGLGCSHIYNGVTTDMLYEKIIVLKNRQDILATVREVTKTILLTMDRHYAKLLVAKYVNKYTYKQIASKLNISIRTVFRHFEKATNEFCSYLKAMGYGEDEWFRGEYFLENVYQNLQDKKQQTENAEDFKNCKNATKEVA